MSTLTLPYQQGSLLQEEGVIVRCSLQRDAQLKPFWRFWAEIGQARLRCYAWLGQYEGLQELVPGLAVRLEGKEQIYNNCERSLICKRLEPLTFELSIFDQNRARWALLLSLITDPDLRQWLTTIEETAEWWETWQQLPASRRYHHAYPGGLMEHSLDCAFRVLHEMAQEGAKGEVVALAALFHDLGKIKTHHRNGTLTSMGECVHHESLTVLVLAPYLITLEQQAPDFAYLLIHLLTYKQQPLKRRTNYHEEVVGMADRLSAIVSASK